MRERELGYSIESVDGNDQRFEYLLVTVEPREKLSAARARINEHSEYGRWELTRSTILYGGRRTYLLRRRVMKLHKTTNL